MQNPSPFLKVNKENYNPFSQTSKTSKSNQFSDWKECKSIFLSPAVTCDLLNFEAPPSNRQATPNQSLSSIDPQPSLASPLPSLVLNTCTSFPIDFDLLDMGFMDPTPNSKSFDAKNLEQNPQFKSPEVSWLDFSEVKNQEEVKLKVITENGSESLLCFRTPISRPSLIALLTNIGVNLERGFYLVDNEGKVYFLDDIPNLSTELTYYCKTSADNINVLFNLDDKIEKNKIEVDAFSHVEFLSSLKPLQEGVTLLKITREGEAKFKFFQLNTNQSSILWYSSHKLQNQTEIPIKNILEIKAGQRTKGFEKLGMMNLSSLSFSLKYLANNGDEGYLDVICKERQEFDIIVTALKGLSSSTKGEKISKQVLLGHVKRFNIMIQDKKPFDCKCLWELFENDPLRVEDCVLKPVSNEKELMNLLFNVEKKHQKLYESNKVLIDNVMKGKKNTQDLDEENIRYYYPKFCKRYIALQQEICEFAEQDLPNLNFFLDFIQLRTMDITKDPLESYLKSQRPENKRNVDDLNQYFDVLNREIWRIGLDIENLKDFIERIKDKMFGRGKVEKLAEKVEGKILDKFSEIGDVFSNFGKSISLKLEALKEDFL